MFCDTVPLFLLLEREGVVKRVSQETCLVFVSGKHRSWCSPIPDVIGMLSRLKACDRSKPGFPSQPQFIAFFRVCVPLTVYSLFKSDTHDGKQSYA